MEDKSMKGQSMKEQSWVKANAKEAYALGCISLQEYIIATGTTDAWDIVKMLDNIEASETSIELDKEDAERKKQDLEEFYNTKDEHYLSTQHMLGWLGNLYWYEHYKHSYDGSGRTIPEWYKYEQQKAEIIHCNHRLAYLHSGEPERLKREEQIRLLADEAAHLGIGNTALARFTWNILATERERSIFWDEYTRNSSNICKEAGELPASFLMEEEQEDSAEQIELKDGIVLLSGFCDVPNIGGDEDTGWYEDWYEDTDGYIIQLNGRNYAVYLDPNDGYRSYGVFHETTLPCTMTFPPQEVLLETLDTEGGYDWYEEPKIKGIRLKNAETGELILEVSTVWYDNLYPMGTCDYRPENMPINKQK